MGCGILGSRTPTSIRPSLPPALSPECRSEHREKVVEYIAEHDDAILTKYLEQHKLEPAELRASLRRSTIALKLVPVIAGSAFKNKGVQPLLDAVIDYLPSPVDVPPVEGVQPDTEEPELRRAADEQPFAALAFKIMNDPYVGHLTFIRVYSGVLKQSQNVYNSTRKTRERVGRLLRMLRRTSVNKSTRLRRETSRRASG